MKYSTYVSDHTKLASIKYDQLQQYQIKHTDTFRVTFRQAVKLVSPYVAVRVMAQIKSVAPLALYLIGFQVLLLQQTLIDPILTTLGLCAVVIGLAVFMEGLKTGLMPFGNIIGNTLPKKVSVYMTLIVITVLGVGVTFAEPAIGALQTLGASVDPTTAPYLYEILKHRSLALVLVVGAGVGLAAMLGVIRFLRGWSLKPLIYLTLLPTILLTIYVWEDSHLMSVLGLAWDCGAVTTGPVTVPLVLSLGIGIANSSGKGQSSLSGFGVVTLASLFPIMAVLCLCVYVSSVISPEEILSTYHSEALSTSTAVYSVWDQTPLVEIALGIRAILPLVIFLFFVLAFILKAKLENRTLTLYGLVLCVTGMCIFNIGLTYGLGSIGSQTGSVLPSAFMPIDGQPDSPLYGKEFGLTLVVMFAWFLGFGATIAEPALNALGITVQNLTEGAFKKSMLMYSVACGVAVGIAVGIVKIIYSLDLASLLLPLYFIAIALTFFSTEEYVNVAWDSAGVTTGPVTVPLVMATGLGLGNALSSADGFGVLSLASICPIIAVLSMGLYIRLKQVLFKRQEEDYDQ